MAATRVHGGGSPYEDLSVPYEPPYRTLRFRYRLLSSAIRVLPDFIIIGAQKGGTTSLYNYLIAHPQIIAGLRKEPSYFDQHWHARSLLWYRAHFPTRLQHGRERRSRMLTGEASTTYLFHPHAPWRAARVVPQAKLIVLLRNPVDRAYSNYRMEVIRGREALAFEDAIARDADRIQGEMRRMERDEGYYSIPFRIGGYLEKGVYVEQLKRWLAHFRRDQVLIIDSEAFFAEPGAIFKRALLFLGIAAMELPVYPKAKESRGEKLALSTRKRLLDYFRPHNERLYEYLGVRFDWER